MLYANTRFALKIQKKPQKRGRTMAEVTELKPSNQTQSGDIPPEKEAGTATPATPTRKAGPGRPPNGQKRPPEGRQPAFFDMVAAVPAEDWGTRAFMYVYVEEPCCNPKNIAKIAVPTEILEADLALEGLKQDYGRLQRLDVSEPTQEWQGRNR